MRRTLFTFFEMMVVAVIMALTAAIVLPMVTGMPRRIEVENALSSIRQAISETSMRARATATALKLVLDEETGHLAVQKMNPEWSDVRGWTPPHYVTAEVEETASKAIELKDSYEMPSSIEWLPEETGLDSQENIEFLFFEDGQAGGRPLRFNVGPRCFQLDIDTLTGDALIEELE